MDTSPKNLSDCPILMETKTTGFTIDPAEFLLQSLEFTFYEGYKEDLNFAYTTGWRNLPFSVLCCLLSNSAQLEVKGKPAVTIKAGEAIVIPVGVAHKYDVSKPEGVSVVWMHFSFRLLGCLDLFSLVEPLSLVLTGSSAASGERIIRELVGLYTTTEEDPLLLMARRNAAVARFLIFLLDLFPVQSQYTQLIQLSQRLKPTLDYIRKNYAQPLTRDQLARTAHLSRSRFHGLFHQLTSMAPLDYVKHCRLEAAQLLLLTTEKRITDIALAVGYSDPFHFSRLFKAKVGVSPRQFRQNCVEISRERA